MKLLKLRRDDEGPRLMMRRLLHRLLLLNLLKLLRRSDRRRMGVKRILIGLSE